MGKKYLETKKDSLEASVLNVWQKAVEQTQEITDNAQMLKNPEENTQKEEADLDEAVLKGRDYEYDEKKGVVKISKKNFAKVHKDYKGTDKSKPTMMVLTKKGTSLVPVQFEEVEIDEARQLKDPKKEVMVVKGNKVVVIDKKDEKKFIFICVFY